MRFPGPYALTHKQERVSSLIARAGGLLPTAYSDGGRFFRDLDTAEQIDIGFNALRFNAALQDPDSLAAVEQVLEIVGVRVNINLTAALQNPAGRDDIVLQP